MINAVLTLLLLFFHSLASATSTLPHDDPVPGGIAVIKLHSQDSAMPVVKYNDNRVLVMRNDQNWYAIVGIPLTEKPGNHTLQTNTRGTPIKFTVNDKQYKTQKITIEDKRKVEPGKEDLKRIAKEKRRMEKAFSYWSDRSVTTLEFLMPVAGELSSPFGLRRFFNDLPRNPHSGLDIAAPKGAPVQAPLDGVVIDTGDFFFNGNSIFIEHGQGLVTLYCHLDSIKVKKGQHVTQGDVIGTVGNTGRATGPHLHWSISLNNARVDPSLFMDQQTSQPVE